MATFAEISENLHIVLSSPYYIAFILTSYEVVVKMYYYERLIFDKFILHCLQCTSSEVLLAFCFTHH